MMVCRANESSPVPETGTLVPYYEHVKLHLIYH